MLIEGLISMNMKKNSLLLITLASFSMITATAYAQTCDTDMTRTAPDSRFKDLGNGEVEDLSTGLVWQRCSIGQMWNGTTCTGNASNLNWQQALSKSKALGKNYRLPNFKEIASIREIACKVPINTTYFPKLPESGFYWTSTPHSTNGSQALLFNLTGNFGVSQIPDAMTKQMLFGGTFKGYALAVRNK